MALVLRALGLGDLLAGVPALRCLRRALPEHEIVLAAHSVLEPLVGLTGAVDRLLPQRELEPLDWDGPGPDVAVDLHGNGPASHTILEALHPRVMVAFDAPGTGSDRPVWDEDEHERARWCRLLTSTVGGEADPDDVELDVPDVPAALEGVTVVHPGATFAARRWPADRFAAVARTLARQGHRVVVTGTPDERGLAGEVAAAAGLPDEAVLAGRTDLAELAALVAGARAVVCGDTGVGHLASAFTTPSVLLFGPTPPHRWGPPDAGPHTVVWRGSGVGNLWEGRPDPALLRIGVAEVLEACEALPPHAHRSPRAGYRRTDARSTRIGQMTGTSPPGPGSPEAELAGFEQSHAATVVAEGPELRISAANAAARAVVGEEIIGTDLAEALSGAMIGQLIDRVREVYATGRPWVGRDWQARHPDGERYVVIHATPWHATDGTVRGVVVQGVNLGPQVGARRDDAQRMAAVTEDYERVSEVVTAMQDALLPTTLPVVPGVEISARYLLQENLSRSGGDWFDALALADGRVVLVVGDVVGSGVSASAIMGQLRAVLHERLAGGADAPEALAVLDRFARNLPEAQAATACVVQLDSRSGRLTYCTAGHPPPLVLEADGRSRYLPGTGGRPLGVSHGPGDPHDFPVLHDQLDPDALVLLYSDGAVERPGRSVSENTVELARVVSTIRETPLDGESMGQLEVARVCERTLDVLAWLSGYDDDITLVAAQRVPTLVPFHAELPARPSSADRLRTELGRWLHGLALAELDRTVLIHAANELASNAIDHAYRRDADGNTPPDAVVEMHADLLSTGCVELTVCDHGSWREPDRAERYRGRGLALTAGLVDELELVPGGREAGDGAGTVARIRHRVHRAASLVAPMPGKPPATERSGRPFSLSVDEERRRVTVGGTVDEQSSDRLLAALRTVSRGGAVSVTADLSAVSQLPSVAVRSLYEVHSHMQPPAELRLLADMGTPAQHVLDIVGLPRS
ncbi:MAG TPA: SpoIIE family protein phosphatase [Marmoricola sp.]|nr:SpoIIE family protein phosphatase [Marmoricola sp.]